jgi:phage shock protein A
MAKVKAKPMSLGDLADTVFDKKLEEAQVKARLEEIERERKGLEDKLQAAMDDSNTSVVEGSRGHAEISETSKPKIDDYEAFATFVIKRKATHLFERRVHAGAYKELREQLGGKPIPGLSDFTVRRLNVRKAS